MSLSSLPTHVDHGGIFSCRTTNSNHEELESLSESSAMFQLLANMAKRRELGQLKN